jgi:hypothetical protein
MSNREKLAAWIFALTRGVQGLSRLELVHSLEETQRAPIGVWRMPAAAANDAIDLGAIAGEMFDAAENDGLTRYQARVTYRALAYEAAAGDESGARPFRGFAFVVPGGRKDPDAVAAGAHGEVDLMPTKDGFIASLIKHVETMQRQFLLAVEGRTSTLERQNATLVAQVEGADKRKIEMFALLESLSVAKAERELHERRMALEEQNSKYLQGKLDVLAPIAMNRLLGGGPGTGKLPMGDELIKQLFGQMAPEQLEALISGQSVKLTEAQAILVAEIYSTFGSAEKAREAMRQGTRPLNSSGNSSGAASDQNGAAAAPGDKPS